MSDYFLDSNICVYMFDSTDVRRQDKALLLLKDNPNISSQVIIETYLACSRKLMLPAEVCEQNVRILCDMTVIATINSGVFEKALHIKIKNKLSFLDSVIIAAALQTGCVTLYSEDLQHGMIIENRLRIVNPFL